MWNNRAQKLFASSLLALALCLQTGTASFAEEVTIARAWPKMIESMGILYFYRPDCRYCHEQREIFQSFLSHSGWRNITAVDISTQRDTAERFGVRIVPDIWLIGNVNGSIQQQRVGIGLLREEELVQEIYAKYQMWFPGE